MDCSLITANLTDCSKRSLQGRGTPTGGIEVNRALKRWGRSAARCGHLAYGRCRRSYVPSAQTTVIRGCLRISHFFRTERSSLAVVSCAWRMTCLEQDVAMKKIENISLPRWPRVAVDPSIFGGSPASTRPRSCGVVFGRESPPLCRLHCSVRNPGG